MNRLYSMFCCIVFGQQHISFRFTVSGYFLFLGVDFVAVFDEDSPGTAFRVAGFVVD